MMRLLKIALAATACVAVLLAVKRDLVTRYHCSAEKKRTELWLKSARDSGSPERRMAVGRDAIPRLARCVESDPSDYEAMFLLGVAQSEAGRTEAALRTFEAALALNERPETYARIGLLQLESGLPEEARRNLLTAAYFNLFVLTDTLDPDTAYQLSYAAEERRERLLAQRKSRAGS